MSPILKPVVRLMSSAQRQVAFRAFSNSAVSRSDPVQQIYINHLKTYQPPPTQQSDLGQVKSFAQPPKPSPPTLPADISSELSAFDASEPDLSSSPSSKAAEALADDTGAGPTEFLAFLEKDLPKPEHHH